MNLTCSYCQTPFTLGMTEKVAALQRMHAENLHHYDAHCPRCGRANAVSRERLEMFTPGWEEAVKAAAPESAPVPPAQPAMPAPQPPAPRLLPKPPAPAPMSAPKASPKPAAKKPVKKAKPAKKVAKAKPKKAVKKPAAKKKTKRK
ncbi:MAG TPA: hypothetical protein VLX61_02705 [Anaerolineales bacterium]|nr:hypothetical protein [Anaerolineales bacterium]